MKTLPKWLTDAPLQVELVPASSWGDNLRTILKPAEWDLVRASCYRRAGWRCEICNGVGPKHPVECHEVWRYDDTMHTQTLERLIALCPACHEAKHAGRANVNGRLPVVIGHLSAVNGWTEQQAQTAIAYAFAIFELRSVSRWTVKVDKLQELLADC